MLFRELFYNSYFLLSKSLQKKRKVEAGRLQVQPQPWQLSDLVRPCRIIKTGKVVGGVAQCDGLGFDPQHCEKKEGRGFAKGSPFSAFWGVPLESFL